MGRMDIIGLVLFVLGLYASRTRDGRADVIRLARLPSYKPWEVPSGATLRWARGGITVFAVLVPP